MLAIWALLGAALLALTALQISSASEQESSTGQQQRSITIESLIPQAGALHLPYRGKIESIQLNGKQYQLPPVYSKHSDLSYKTEFPLKAGRNVLRINYNRQGFITNQKEALGISVLQVILLVLFQLPLLIVFFTELYLALLSFFPVFRFHFFRKFLKHADTWLLVIALILKLVISFAINKNFVSFQHDLPHHIDYINYLVAHESAPPNHGEFEFHQLPLYYFLCALCRNLLPIDPELSYRLLSLFLTSALTIIFFFALRKLSKNIFFRLVCLVFITFTPRIVLQSITINNDVLIFFSGTVFISGLIYYLSKPSSLNLAFLLSGALISFGTKLNGLTQPFVAFIVASVTPQSLALKKKHVFAVLFSTSVLLFCIFYRHYDLLNQKSFFFWSNLFPGLEIPGGVSFEYLFSFDLGALLTEGQACTWSQSECGLSIKHSLPSYLYGTMLFGEFEYQSLFAKNQFLFILSQALIILNLIIPLSILYFVFRPRKFSLLEQICLALPLLNLLAVISVLYKYPVNCNADFRYLFPAVGCIALLVGFGFQSFTDDFKPLKRLLCWGFLPLWSLSSLLWCLLFCLHYLK